MDIKKFPANIYKTYLEYSNENDKNRKLSLLFDVFGQIIRFFGCVFLSEYMYSKNVDSKLNDTIVGLTRPSLGSWLAFIREYVRCSEKHSAWRPFIQEFADAYIEVYKFKDYRKQYTGRFRNPAMKKSGAIDEILALRNAIAHGAMSPSKEEALEITDIYDQYIQKMLSEFSVIFGKYTVAKVDEIEDEISECTVYFDLIRYYEKRNERYPMEFESDQDFAGVPVDEYIQEGKMYLISDDGRILRFAEYLVDIMHDPEHEDYYLYDGYGNSYVDFVGMTHKKRLIEYLEAIKAKFSEKGAANKWSKRVFEYDSFRNYVNSLTDASISIHNKSRKYIPEVYIKRECDYLLDDFIESDKTTMIVTAEAGVGKTNFLCHASEKLIKKGNTVYFYNGGTLTETGEENVLFLRLRRDCLEEKEFHNTNDFLIFLNEKKTGDKHFVIVVDAANEAYNVLNVLQEIDRITTIGDKYPWLKIVVSIRTVSFEIFRNRITDTYGKKIPFLTDKDRYYSVSKDGQKKFMVEIEEWNIIQVIDAFEKYRKKFRIDDKALIYHNMDRKLQELLKNPLNMGLFFDARNNIPELKIATEEDLFMSMEHFWNENSVVTKSVKLVQDEIVSEMIRLKCNELDSDIVRAIDEKRTLEKIKDIQLLLLTPLERLRDEGIIFEREEGGFFFTSFVYQKYLEYLLLRKIKADNLNLQDVIDLMVESSGWDKLPEMYMACQDYLEQYPDPIMTSEKVLNVLLDKGSSPSEYQTTLIELLKRAASNGQSEQVVEMLKHYNIRHWGTILVRCLNEEEESDAARDILNALLGSDDDGDEELYYLRGLYHMKVSELDEAEKDFIRCTDSRNEELKSAAIVQLAKNYRKKGNVPKSKDLLEKFISQRTAESYKYADAMIQLGLCKYSDHKFEAALADYEIALEITQKNKDHYTTLYNMLGISTVRAERKELDECEKILLDVYKMAGQYGYIDLRADSLNGLATNFNRKKEYEKAVSYAEQALVIWEHSHFYTGMMVMYSRLIEAYSCIGNREDKVKKYKDAADKILPKIKETVILDCYEKAMKYVKSC